MTPKEEDTRKTELEAMILRVNHKSEMFTLNAAALYQEMDKEVQHGFSLPLKTDSSSHVKYTGFITLGVSNKLSILKNW